MKKEFISYLTSFFLRVRWIPFCQSHLPLATNEKHKVYLHSRGIKHVHSHWKYIKKMHVITSKPKIWTQGLDLEYTNYNGERDPIPIILNLPTLLLKYERTLASPSIRHQIKFRYIDFSACLRTCTSKYELSTFQQIYRHMTKTTNYLTYTVNYQFTTKCKSLKEIKQGIMLMTLVPTKRNLYKALPYLTRSRECRWTQPILATSKAVTTTCNLHVKAETFPMAQRF